MNEMKLFDEITIHLSYNELREHISKLFTELNSPENHKKKLIICKKIISEKSVFLNHLEQADLFYITAKNAYYIHDTKESEHYCHKALEVLNFYDTDEFINNKIVFLYTAVYNILGTIKIENGHIFDSIAYYGMGYEKSFLGNDIHLSNALLANICEALMHLNMHQKSLKILNTIKHFATENFDEDTPYLKHSLANVTLNQSTCHAELGNLKKAKELYKEIPMYMDPNNVIAFRYPYLHLQSMITQKDDDYEKADELFDEVYDYYLRNQTPENSSKILIKYLIDYIKRKEFDEQRFLNFLNMAEHKAGHMENLYLQSMLVSLRMKYLLIREDHAGFREQFARYKEAVERMYDSHITEYGRNIHRTYEDAVRKRKNKDNKTENVDYQKLKFKIKTQQGVYRKMTDTLEYMNRLAQICKDNTDHEANLVEASRILKGKIHFDVLAISLVNHQTGSVDFLLADEADAVSRISTNKDNISKHILDALERSTNQPFFIHTKSDSFISNEFGKNYNNLLICKLLEGPDFYAVALLYSDSKREYNSEELKAFEFATPFLSIAVQNHFIKKSIRLTLSKKSDYAKSLEPFHRKLHSMPKLDGLTGVPNKKHFDTRSLLLFRSAIEGNRSIAMFLVDIDDFKAYNEHYGYRMADRSLKAVANALLERARAELQGQDEEAIFARLYGDQFVLMYADRDDVDDERLARSLIEAVRDLQIEHLHSGIGTMSVCIGGTRCLAEEETHLNDLLDEAKTLLRIAKMKGENSHFIKAFVAKPANKNEDL